MLLNIRERFDTLKLLRNLFHPLLAVRIAGLLDGVSLLVLLGIAMPLKYIAGLPNAVTIVGSIHGGIFIIYLIAIVYAQLRLQWHVKWSLFALLAAVIPFGNFVLDHYFRKNQELFVVKVIPKIWLVYTIIFFTFMDLFTQLPVMSTYAESLGASAAMAGFVVGAYSLTNMFGNMISGILTDRYGAYVILSIGLITTSFSLFLYSAISSVSALVLLRFFHGLLSGLIVPAAFTYLANQTRAEKQGSQSAFTGAFVGTAAIVGPAYSGILANKTSVPFVFATIASIGLILFGATLFKLKTKEAQAEKEQRSRGRLVWNKGMIQAFTGAFFLMFSQGALAYLLSLYVEELGYSSRLSGTLMSMFGIVAVLIFLLPTNKIFDRISPLVSFLTGLGLIGISQILIGQNSEMGALYGVLALYGIGFALLFPAMNTLLIRSTSKQNRGQAYGYFYAFFSIGTVAGSWSLGLLPYSLNVKFTITGVILLLCVTSIGLSARPMKKMASSNDQNQVASNQ